MEIIVGTKAEVGALVEREDTAKEVGSGDLLVYATPCMTALMEGAACEAIEQAIPQGQTSVGTALNLEHLSATPVGLEVRAEAVLTAVESRSSSPVRIPRGENGQSPIRGLYPCGEGAGYAGGILSAAADGMRCAEKLLEVCK